jgi:hypothetical protein
MRKIAFLILLLPLKSLCQCPTWTGSSVENAKALKPLIQKYFQFNFKDIPDTIDAKEYKTLAYKDKKVLALFTIGWYIKNASPDINSTSFPAIVTDIIIKGPADKIDKLIAELNKQAQSCPAYSNGKEWIKFSNYIIRWEKTVDKDGVAMKYISIKPITLK